VNTGQQSGLVDADSLTGDSGKLRCRLGNYGRISYRTDFRRTVMRNLERAGVARSVAMELVGHKTESVYQRYDIVAERDLTDGVARYAARFEVSRLPVTNRGE
jgi:hypothetical protein